MFVVPDRPHSRVPICFAGLRSLANGAASYLKISADFDKARRLPILSACSRAAQLQGFRTHLKEFSQPDVPAWAGIVHHFKALMGL